MRNSLCLAVAIILAASVSYGAIVDFAGGTAFFNGGGSAVASNATSFDNVDYYQENGYELDFIGGVGVPFSAHIGDYYGAGNAVIHSHWATGSYGTITIIEGTEIGGGAFDLNYFILTSNTDTGGAPASGNEQAFINAYDGVGGTNLLGSVMLPSEDWGFPATQIFLPAMFDAITKFTITVTNPVDCFGMDEFYINEPAPPQVPEPSTLVIWSLLGALGLAVGWYRRR